MAHLLRERSAADAGTDLTPEEWQLGVLFDPGWPKGVGLAPTAEALRDLQDLGPSGPA